MTTRTLSIFALALLAAHSAHALTIDNGPALGPSIGTFGISSTANYGQTFNLTSSQVLDSWSFFAAGGLSGNLMFHVGTWGPAASACDVGDSFCTGKRALTSLYSAAGAYAGNVQTLTFDNINLSMAAGSYVAYLTVAGVANPVSQASFEAGSSTVFAPDFVYAHNGAQPNASPLSYTTPWSTYTIDPDVGGIADMRFSATFSESVAVSAVPEPTTYALMLAGLGVVGFAARRRKAA